jgi:hypothetical protein
VGHGSRDRVAASPLSEHTHDAAPVEAVAAPPQAAPALPAMPFGAQLARSASAMGNQAFGAWAQTAGAEGEPFPSLSAHRAWGPAIARAPGDTATAAPDQASDDDTEEPIDVKGMQFGKSLLDGVIPAGGGDLSKTISGSIGKRADFPGASLQVPLFPGVFASFAVAGAMSANAAGSVTFSGTNLLHAASGRAKKQHVAVSGSGNATGTIAGSLAAGVHVGVQGLANVGLVAQGSLVFHAQGDASFAGSLQRFKPKGEAAWLPWSGELTFDANLKGSLIAAANGYFEYQLLWIYQDRFGQFKIGEWTLAEAELHVKGSLRPREGLQVDITPKLGPLLKPGISPQLRQRTQEERDRAEKLAQQGEAGVPRIARSMRLARDDTPPDDGKGGGGAGAAPPPDAGGGSSSGAAPAPAAGPDQATLDAEPKIEDA